ncbi:hypothetical protein CJP74_02295 [Psittacicella melopsittaci]|uniref:AB hydrolase-1 domain-containing protein n=1 Tax=Psittacicella melopsittaci TaxID=2028576 RepID=A0A3A1YAY6_9GAMM|nr:alpha/beta fold hydrolase [Psittacicella melopsittaci]RIY33277.1 hypothetical protein CJP74_02295 [Psittacicella melopsittaci]
MTIERNLDLLNHQYTYNEELKDRPTLVLIHGLMGDLNNLGMIGRHFADRFNILRVDLVNHGHSFYRNQMEYPEMANDVLKVVDHYGIKDIIPVGHSMGGKVAMRIAFDYASRCRALVVLDMAPVIYGKRGHDDVFYAINQVIAHNCQERDECREILKANLDNQGVINFLLKSFTNEEPHKFLFNAPVLEKEYNHIGIWEEHVYNGPSAFIYGGDSPYVDDERQQAIPRQFPKAKLYCVEGATHWLHAEQPRTIFQYMENFFENNGILPGQDYVVIS